jgi:catechol 2,3-dioxygenase-like lactoylglutathione lyase family enzyme
MIFGAHVIVYSKDAEADRAFFRDALGFKSVDAGHGWLIFALPPAEAAFHPDENPGENDRHELYLMCDDLKAEMSALKRKGVRVPTFTGSDGVRSPGSSFQAGDKSVFTSRSIPRRWLQADRSNINLTSAIPSVYYRKQVCSSEQTLDFMKSG